MTWQKDLALRITADMAFEKWELKSHQRQSLYRNGAFHDPALIKARLSFMLISTACNKTAKGMLLPWRLDCVFLCVSVGSPGVREQREKRLEQTETRQQVKHFPSAMGGSDYSTLDSERIYWKVLYWLCINTWTPRCAAASLCLSQIAPSEIWEQQLYCRFLWSCTESKMCYSQRELLCLCFKGREENRANYQFLEVCYGKIIMVTYSTVKVCVHWLVGKEVHLQLGRYKSRMYSMFWVASPAPNSLMPECLICAPFTFHDGKVGIQFEIILIFVCAQWKCGC